LHAALCVNKALFTGTADAGSVIITDAALLLSAIEAAGCREAARMGSTTVQYPPPAVFSHTLHTTPHACSPPHTLLAAVGVLLLLLTLQA